MDVVKRARPDPFLYFIYDENPDERVQYQQSMREVELSVLPAALTYVVDGRNIISKATIKFATYKHAVSHVLHNSAIPKRKDVQIRLHR